VTEPENSQPNNGRTALVGSTNDLATEEPGSWFDQTLQWIPRILSSKPHVIILIGLGIYLIVLPLTGVRVGPGAELIGGNYTNVTSDIGASIAAGGTLHLVGESRRRRKIDEERLLLARQTHHLLHHVYAQAARELGHVGPGAARMTDQAGQPPPGASPS
jgi:hypothetical protein